MRQSTTPRASDVGRFGQLLRQAGLAGPIEYLFQIFHGLLHPHLLRSGATPRERSMPLAGDDVVPDATWVRTRAQTVRASPERIWLWLAQLGADRGGWPGWYPFTRPHDTAARVVLGRSIAPGDALLEVVGPESSARWDVVAVEPASYLVLHSCRTLGTGEPVTRSPGRHWTDISWTFVIRPQPDGSSRLLARTRSVVSPRSFDVAMRWLGTGDTVMQRELLAAIAWRAERTREMRAISR
ncbi:MAG TPA: hypothetical protein VFQ25_12000 [Ktedonobacterales bacterium]|nr:hypothetical protein [Ktedonobacterales bacterium]